MKTIIAIAGASGDLGERVARALAARDAEVRALVRRDASADVTQRIAALGATPVCADSADVASMARALEGATCVISTLNGLRDVIVDRQVVLLNAAVQAGVPRFIPSDFAADFTKIPPGDNRNFDLRREFMTHADRSPLAVTSILNGAFMDMLGAEMPIIQPRVHRVLCWGSAEQPLDFTMKDDVAAYTAEAALDAKTPRWLRIAGDVVTASDIANAMTEATHERYRTLRVGGLRLLSLMIRIAKLAAPQPHETFPPWQGMQYMRDMFSGRARLAPLDNARYPSLTGAKRREKRDLKWTSVREHVGRLAK